MNRLTYLLSSALVGFVFFIACSNETEKIIPKPADITYGTITDKAGNSYKTFTIGKQTWLAENFRYKLPDGDASEQICYGEIYGINEREIIEGTDEKAYQHFCRSYSGQSFLLYLREQIFASNEAGKLNTNSMFDAIWISEQISNYSMPMLIAYNMHNDIKDELMRIWNDAIDHHFKIDHEYINKYGYLYSYEGALRAVKEGAPEGFHLPTDAEWMMLERSLGMTSGELEGTDIWRGNVGDLLKTGPQGIGFDALYAGAAVYALSTAYNTYYIQKGESAFFWCSDQVFVSDSLSNGIVRKISIYRKGIQRMTSRLIASPDNIRPSYNIRLVKIEK